MSNPEVWVAIIAGVALLVDIAIHLIGGTYLLARSRETLATQLSDRIEERKQAMDAELGSFRNQIGETFNAVRQAIQDVNKEVNRVELEAYKAFVQRDSFYEVMNRQQDVVAARLDRLDTKLDQTSRDTNLRIKEVETKLDKAIQTK